MNHSQNRCMFKFCALFKRNFFIRFLKFRLFQQYVAPTSPKSLPLANTENPPLKFAVTHEHSLDPLRFGRFPPFLLQPREPPDSTCCFLAGAGLSQGTKKRPQASEIEREAARFALRGSPLLLPMNRPRPFINLKRLFERDRERERGIEREREKDKRRACSFQSNEYGRLG